MTREMTKAGGRKGERRNDFIGWIFQHLGQEDLTYLNLSRNPFFDDTLLLFQAD